MDDTTKAPPIGLAPPHDADRDAGAAAYRRGRRRNPPPEVFADLWLEGYDAEKAAHPRPSRTHTPAQARASRRNWSLCMLRGMIGNFTATGGHPGLDVDCFPDDVRDHLTTALRELKAADALLRPTAPEGS